MKRKRRSEVIRRWRDKVISFARYGKITPDEAEAKAAALGLDPFAQQPPLPQFDPMMEARWSLVMTIAWISWRDISFVREQNAAFRSECTRWLFQDWKGPSDDGTTFEQNGGWFLEPWSKVTVLRLLIGNAVGQVLPVREAEQVLLRTLMEGQLAADAMNETGRPVAIPERDWTHLKIHEERETDVLKYTASGPVAFTKVTFKRDDVLRRWPRVTHKPANLALDAAIDGTMLKPMSSPGGTGFVPLCSALQWIMSKGGAQTLKMNDVPAWDTACDQLLALIQEGEIELLGVGAGTVAEMIPPHTLALVKVLSPSDPGYLTALPDARVYISCMPFIDKNHWHGEFNDRLYFSDRPGAIWTHLQVRKSQILKRWPRPESRALPEAHCLRWLTEQMQASPDKPPGTKEDLLAEACRLFPALKPAQFERSWQKARVESGATGWGKPGPRPKSIR